MIMTQLLPRVNESSKTSSFRLRFPSVTPTAMVKVPGRVNLIGEHVDYCDGIVLPIAIEPSIRVVVGPQADPRLNVYSEAYDDSFERDLGDLERPAIGWSAYVRGIATELRSRNIKLAGVAIYVGGDLPIGAGLASSAALCAGVGMALLHTAGVPLPSVELAELCRDAEHHCVGVPCGIMDPLACLSARKGWALRVDCRTGESRHIRWPEGDLVALVVDSRFRHALSAGEYAARVRECREAALCLKEFEPTINSLREVSAPLLESHRADFDPAIYRRGRHVVTEIDRADRAAAALEANDAALFGRLMNESHASLRDDFECCPQQIDDLAAVIRKCPGVYGARLTGGGFGGCVVALAWGDAQKSVEAALRTGYDEKYGLSARLWCCRPCQGATLTLLANG